MQIRPPFQKQELDPRSKLPVTDPNYLYPPSRNPYYEKLDALGVSQGFVDSATEIHAGHWRALMPDAAQASARRPLHVEVGCNAGHVILEWAARNPDTAFIGVDWKIKAVFWAVEKAKKRGIKNILFLRAHANRLQHVFGPGEVNELAIYFPDPWPAKSQWKNRWVTATRLTQIANLLTPSGRLDIKTDHPGYFDWMLDAAAQVPGLFKTLQLTRDLHADHPDPTQLRIPEVTLFERLFIQDGVPIQRLHLQKC